MSMYTQLLRAALELPLARAGDDRDTVFDRMVRQRRELQQTLRPDQDPDTVAALLARQASYDVALMRLASEVGITTDPSRFDEPGRERARLEKALDGLGLSLDCVPSEGQQPERKR